jgi:hypothetical protein
VPERDQFSGMVNSDVLVGVGPALVCAWPRA